MKKILVIMMMMCVVLNVSVEAKTKKTTHRRKAKVERQMTEFEKSQKEEYLAYLLYKCRAYYGQEDYDMADHYKRWYEEAKRENYYITFDNPPAYSEKEKAERERLGLKTFDLREFYMNGYVFGVYFDYKGEAVDYITELEGIYDYGAYNDKETHKLDFRSGGKKETKERLLNEINEQSGYNAKHAKKRSDVEQFINQH